MLAMWLSLRMSISIHSLVKRETDNEFVIAVIGYNFNPLPRKEGDEMPLSCIGWSRNFNPLPRKEGDSCKTNVARCHRYFNPLPRKEGDGHMLAIIFVHLAPFQSTPS